MISSRLQAIASLIPKNSSVIDIGCDHALLDIFLARNKNCSCIASDININCLNKAIKNINKYNLNNEIKTVVSDGLNNIDYSDDDYIIISGMGFQTIKKILKSHKPNRIIIQSNTEIEKLRLEVLKNYKIKEEKVVFEKDKCYVVLYLERGKQKYKYEDCLIGKNKDNNYIKYLLNKHLNIYKRIPKKYIFKRLVLLKKIIVLQKYTKKH